MKILIYFINIQVAQQFSQNWSSSTIFNIIAERQQQFNENNLWESREKDPGSEGWALTAGQSKENEGTESSTETEPTMLPGALVASELYVSAVISAENEAENKKTG